MEEAGESGELIREPMVEGIFYPAEPEVLSARLGQFLSREETVPQEFGLIVSPHGSQEFSGQVMAAAYKAAARLDPRLVVIVAACFHSRETAVYLPESPRFRTPLGDSLVDTEAVASLLETSTLFQRNDLPHLQEHAIEVQLPFIQYLFPQARILPILLGDASEAVVKCLVAGLSILYPDPDPGRLVVFSANLTGILDQNRALRDAQRMLDFVTGGDWQGLLAAFDRRDFIDGNAGPLAAAAWFAQGQEVQVLSRSNSLAAQFDPTNVVEYAALAF